MSHVSASSILRASKAVVPKRTFAVNVKSKKPANSQQATQAASGELNSNVQPTQAYQEDVPLVMPSSVTQNESEIEPVAVPAPSISNEEQQQTNTPPSSQQQQATTPSSPAQAPTPTILAPSPVPTSNNTTTDTTTTSTTASKEKKKRKKTASEKDRPAKRQRTEKLPEQKTTIQDYIKDIRAGSLTKNAQTRMEQRAAKNKAAESEEAVEQQQPAIVDETDTATREETELNTTNNNTEEDDDDMGLSTFQSVRNFVPQVQFIDGKLVLNEESTTIQREEIDYTQDYERVTEVHGAKYITSSTYARHPRTERWSKEETDQFFNAIRQFGCDFTMISRLYPKRTRRQVKNKFKREEKENRDRIESALNNRIPIDVENFKRCNEEKLRLEGIEEQRATHGANNTTSNADGTDLTSQANDLNAIPAANGEHPIGDDKKKKHEDEDEWVSGKDDFDDLTAHQLQVVDEGVYQDDMNEEPITQFKSFNTYDDGVDWQL